MTIGGVSVRRVCEEFQWLHHQKQYERANIRLIPTVAASAILVRRWDWWELPVLLWLLTVNRPTSNRWRRRKVAKERGLARKHQLHCVEQQTRGAVN